MSHTIAGKVVLITGPARGIGAETARRARLSRATVRLSMDASSTSRPAGLSVFFPAYNDSGTIASLVITVTMIHLAMAPDSS